MKFTVRDLTLASLCALLGSVKGLLVSYVKTLGPIEIFGLRSIGATCFLLPIVVFYNFKLIYGLRDNVVLLLRSIVGNIAVCGYYFGFVYLPIAEASLIFYSTPIFTVIIGHFFLDEKCGISEILSILSSLLGVSFVCVPDFANTDSKDVGDMIYGVCGVLIGAVAQAIALAICRKLTHIPPAVVSFWWAFVGIIFSSILCGAKDSLVLWNCGMEVTFIIMIAVVGFASEICLVSALKSTDAVIISIVLTSEIIWAFVLQVFVCKEAVTWLVVIGGLLIVVSVVTPTLANFIKKESRIRSKLFTNS